MNLVRKLSGKFAALVGMMNAVDIMSSWPWISGGLMVVWWSQTEKWGWGILYRLGYYREYVDMGRNLYKD